MQWCTQRHSYRVCFHLRSQHAALFVGLRLPGYWMHAVQLLLGKALQQSVNITTSAIAYPTHCRHCQALFPSLLVILLAVRGAHSVMHTWPHVTRCTRMGACINIRLQACVCEFSHSSRKLMPPISHFLVIISPAISHTMHYIPCTTLQPGMHIPVSFLPTRAAHITHAYEPSAHHSSRMSAQQYNP
jgi:hypothetical protein